MSIISWRAVVPASRRARVIAAASVVAGAAVLGGLVKYSESPSFCNSCHIMDPYYRAWEKSKHNHVPCVECHYPPGQAKQLLWKKFQALSQVAKYVTRTYSSKPFAEIEDSSCLREGCHSTRLLEGRVSSTRGVKFDHRPHLTEPRRGRQLKCVSCHSQMVVGKHIEVTYDTCYLCHFRGLAGGREIAPIGGCVGCHDLPEKTFKIGNMEYNHRDFVTKRGVSCQNCHLDVLYGDGHAPKERCFTCHNQPEKLAKYDDIPFLHDNHVTRHNVACFHCHKEMRHGINAAEGVVPAPGEEAPERDGFSHPPALTFSCSFCHEGTHGGQLGMYTGKVKGLGLPEMPSPMYLAQVDCVGCHYTRETGGHGGFDGRIFRASDKACVKCHGPEFKGIWEETRAEVEACLGKVGAKLDLVKGALQNAGVSVDERKRLEGRISRAGRLRDFVRISGGAHNVYLAAEALRRADGALNDAEAVLKSGAPDLGGDPLISGSYCASMCHRSIGVKVPPDDVTFAGKKMPHGAHAAMASCGTCHRLGGHKEVPLRADVRKTVCAGCHPE